MQSLAFLDHNETKFYLMLIFKTEIFSPESILIYLKNLLSLQLQTVIMDGPSLGELNSAELTVSYTCTRRSVKIEPFREKNLEQRLFGLMEIMKLACI